MDLGTVLSVAQTLLAALQCSQLKNICDVLGYESDLEKLRDTVCTVQAVLMDAEAKQDGLMSMSNQAQTYIDKLKDAVYEADDLLDEFVTIMEQKKELIAEKGPILGEIRLLFSSLNPFSFARKMSKSVDKIRMKLDAIADNHSRFGFKINYEPIKLRREETCSYVNESDIIGRDADVQKLLEILLSSSQGNHTSDGCNFISIVGMGGLGKTALAQLVYNNKRVKAEFPSRIWLCVSDQDQSQLGVKENLIKILRSVADDNKCDDSSLDKVQTQLRQQLAKNKYLLVLDDVWTEDREEWLKLEEFIKGGKQGSWVIVTTRSMATAKIVGNGRKYELEGLSFDDSWRLFQRMAFEKANPTEEDFVQIGREIVERCARVPLAIRVVGSLLFGQSKKKWRSFQHNGLAYIAGDNNAIKSILKLSYYHLKSPLKSCFTYCSIFPKDSVIDKEMIISLWMAQGYIVPFYDGQSIIDAAEECFLILLRRCFFQDVRRNEYNEIVSFMMHDLMHDIAQDVAGKEICQVRTNSTGLDDEKVRHLSLVKENFMKRLPGKIRIRTCLGVEGNDGELLMGLILTKCLRLRSLDLSGLGLKILPESIGNLLHLRYLDLSYNRKLKRLPKSITKLQNLLTLKLDSCSDLEELPKDLKKLHNLYILDISGCEKLKYLPLGMSKLYNLHTLSRYMVGLKNSNVKECFDQLEDLKTLSKLKGSLEIHIQIPNNATYVKEDEKEGAYIKSKEHLTCIHLCIKHEGSDKSSVEYEEALLEELQPHSSLMGLTLKEFRSARLPNWARGDNLANCLPNLVTLEFAGLKALEYLPQLCRLCHLKTLRLVDLPKLEYVEANGYGERGPLSFPCLEDVFLRCLPKLEAWSPESNVVNEDGVGVEPRHLWPRLKRMGIVECPKMSWTPVEGVRTYAYDFFIGLFHNNNPSYGWPYDITPSY